MHDKNENDSNLPLHTELQPTTNSTISTFFDNENDNDRNCCTAVTVNAPEPIKSKYTCKPVQMLTRDPNAFTIKYV